LKHLCKRYKRDKKNRKRKEEKKRKGKGPRGTDFGPEQKPAAAQ
jgi:hypothetical protein